MADQTEDRDGPTDEEAVIEAAWRASRSLHLIAMEVAASRDVSACVKKVLFELADASLDIKPYAKEAIRLVRYVAVREAHDQGGGKVSWPQAVEHAVEKLRGTPAKAEADMMWKDYKAVRKALRDAGCVRDDNDPGYYWVEDKSPPG